MLNPIFVVLVGLLFFPLIRPLRAFDADAIIEDVIQYLAKLRINYGCESLIGIVAPSVPGCIKTNSTIDGTGYDGW